MLKKEVLGRRHLSVSSTEDTFWHMGHKLLIYVTFAACCCSDFILMKMLCFKASKISIIWSKYMRFGKLLLLQCFWLLLLHCWAAIVVARSSFSMFYDSFPANLTIPCFFPHQQEREGKDVPCLIVMRKLNGETGSKSEVICVLTALLPILGYSVSPFR